MFQREPGEFTGNLTWTIAEVPSGPNVNCPGMYFVVNGNDNNPSFIDKYRVGGTGYFVGLNAAGQEIYQWDIGAPASTNA